MSDPPWEPRPFLDCAFGVMRAVSIPVDPPSADVLARLLPEERAFAGTLAPPRLATWVAGRLALAAALGETGSPRSPLLATPRDAPLVPAGFVGSVSHKQHLAVALAARDEGAHLGIDVESTAPPRYDISRRILTEAELAFVDALPPGARTRNVMRMFSIKEAIYKAVDPFVQRFVGFKEAEVEIGQAGEAWARLDLERGEGPFAIEAWWGEAEGMIVSVARIRRG